MFISHIFFLLEVNRLHADIATLVDGNLSDPIPAFIPRELNLSTRPRDAPRVRRVIRPKENTVVVPYGNAGPGNDVAPGLDVTRRLKRPG